jgi:membrane fusion protein, multidrug efflux system
VLGRQLDGLRVVEQGLSEGDALIVHGVQKIFFPGMQVAPQKIAMGEGPAAPVALATAPAKEPKS